MTDEEEQDAAWVSSALRGSDAAFARLVDRHGAALRNFLRRVCLNTDEADDLAQEAFLAAWTSLRHLDAPERFRPWVMGIAWRKAKTAARTAARRRNREAAETLNLPLGTVKSHIARGRPKLAAILGVDDE